MSRLGRLQLPPPVVLRLPASVTFLAAAVTGVGVGSASVTAVRTDTADVAGAGVGAAAVTAGRTDTATVTGAGVGAGVVSATAADPPLPRAPLVVSDSGRGWRARQPAGQVLRIAAPASPPADTAFVDGLGIGAASVAAARADTGGVTGAGAGAAGVAAARTDTGDVTAVGAGAGLVTAARVDTATVTAAGTGAASVAGARSDTAGVAAAGAGVATVAADAAGGSTLTADVLGIGVGAGEVTLHDPVTSPGNGFYGLLGILAEMREMAAQDAARPETACPNDGEPLTAGPDGMLYCRFDGYRPR